MLNHIWLALILLAVLIGGFDSRLKEVADGAVKGAESAVTLALGLIGVMTAWLGMMRLAEKSGLVQALARLLRPVLRRLFPDVPVEHPAMGSMVSPPSLCWPRPDRKIRRPSLAPRCWQPSVPPQPD